MVYTFARIGAATAMTVGDVYVQNRRLWVNLREKGGQVVDLPCHHTLEEYLHAYLDSTGIASDRDGPLFRTIGRGTGQLTRTPLPQANTYAMIQRPGPGRRDPNPDRQSHLPGHRHHGLSQERRHVGEGGGDRPSRLDPHDPAL
jgi:integrase